MRHAVTAAAWLVLLAAPAAAPGQQAGADLAQQIVNDPGAPEVTGAKAALRDDPVVQGGKALRIQIAGKGKNPWDSALATPVKKPVKAGDTLLLAFYARLEKGENGATTATLPFNGVQLADSPWSPIFHEAVEIGPEWKLVQVKGKADRSYGAGKLKVTIQLATAKQVVDVGPVMLLDQGQ
jgi:hypothetical protein